MKKDKSSVTFILETRLWGPPTGYLVKKGKINLLNLSSEWNYATEMKNSFSDFIKLYIYICMYFSCTLKRICGDSSKNLHIICQCTVLYHWEIPFEKKSPLRSKLHRGKPWTDIKHAHKWTSLLLVWRWFFSACLISVAFYLLSSPAHRDR